MAKSTEDAASDEPEKVTSELVILHDRLDGLWERYLELLARYQRAQQDAQKFLSSGFFSLTQANFKSQDRRRYGQDYYDERMRASRRCHMKTEDDDDTTTAFEVIDAAANDPSLVDRGVAAPQAEKDTEPEQQPLPPGTPPPDGIDGAAELEYDGPDGLAQADSTAQAVKPALNPLYWFGILIPRELRSAQSSFSSALNELVIQVATTARSMREVEAEIRRLRKAIRKAEKACGA